MRIYCLIFSGALLAGCAQSSPPIVPAPAMLPTSIGNSMRSQRQMYVANGSYPAGSVTVYQRDAQGNAKPARTIAGSKTGMIQPTGIAVDASGNTYVSDFFAGPGYEGAVFVYAAGANGNVQPVATITDGINMPSSVAVDGSGNVYAGNFEGGDVTVYAAGTYTFLRSIGDHDDLGYVAGVTLDKLGTTYVVDADYSGAPRDSGYTQSVFVFAAGTDRLIQTISGARTGLTSPEGIAASAGGRIFVTNYSIQGKPEILEFGAGAKGNTKPIGIIRGAKTQLMGPGIALSASGTVFTTNDGYSSGSSSVTVYPPDARGNVAPRRQLEGGSTGLHDPVGVALH
jgi:hypothetical protein